jgi:xylulokinase
LQISDFNGFIALARKSKPGSGGLFFLPCLAGERASPAASDTHGVWKGLSLSSGREEMANSVLEGICFAIKDMIMVMEDAGAKVNQLRVSGLLASCDYLNQIKADITGKEILEGAYKESELLGLAVIGCCFMGKFKSYAEAIEKLVRIERTYKPKTENAEVYNMLFNEYKNFYSSVKKS